MNLKKEVCKCVFSAQTCPFCQQVLKMEDVSPLTRGHRLAWKGQSPCLSLPEAVTTPSPIFYVLKTKHSTGVLNIFFLSKAGGQFDMS